SRQKQPQVRVLMLIVMHDIGVVPVQEIGNRSHDPFLVRAIHQQYGGTLHGGDDCKTWARLPAAITTPSCQPINDGISATLLQTIPGTEPQSAAIDKPTPATATL